MFVDDLAPETPARLFGAHYSQYAVQLGVVKVDRCSGHADYVARPPAGLHLGPGQGAIGTRVDYLSQLRDMPRAVLLGELALEILGSDAAVRKGEGTLDGGRWQDLSLNWPDVVIGGGTPNIQKNIIAERILGLPKD